MNDNCAPWRKSTYSGSEANCVEVADVASSVLVRDSKHEGRGPVLAFRADAWQEFTATLR